MDLGEARAFVNDHHRAVLLTRRADGGVQSSPVLVVLDRDGQLAISSRESAFKVRNLRRDPWAVLCVLSDEFFGDWLQIEGTAQVVLLPDAMELLVDYYRRAVGEHPDWDDYRAAMERDRRVLVRITPERAGPDRHG